METSILKNAAEKKVILSVSFDDDVSQTFIDRLVKSIRLEYLAQKVDFDDSLDDLSRDIKQVE